MEVVRGDYFLLNRSFLQTHQIDDYLQEKSIQVYEVLRVINFKIAFLDDHIERLKSSILGVGRQIPDESIAHLDTDIKNLVAKNNFSEGNIKILLQFFENEENVFIYFIPHSYPSESDYEKGVEVGLYESVRKNPNIKAVSSVREEINSLLKRKNLYELLLVNDNEEVTEGSRTNVFFIDSENNVVSAPDEVVLKGITRKYAIQICDQEKIPLLFKNVKVNELENYQSAFLTGTSPKILPIKKIENITFDVDSPILEKIMKGYGSIFVSG